MTAETAQATYPCDGRNRLPALPRRPLVDTCVLQWLSRHGEFIWDGAGLESTDRMWRIPGAYDELCALRNIFAIDKRACIPWVVLGEVIDEVEANPQLTLAMHSWAHDMRAWSRSTIAPHAAASSTAVIATACGSLSRDDECLLRAAHRAGCDALITVDRRLWRNRHAVRRRLPLAVLLPTELWGQLRPWAGLWH